MFQAVSISNIATDHAGIIYHAPPTSNYVLARVAASRNLEVQGTGELPGDPRSRGQFTVRYGGRTHVCGAQTEDVSGSLRRATDARNMSGWARTKG
jgi:hypothetical protein